MDDNNRKLRIGLFVCGGIAVTLAALFFLGMSDIFVRKAYIRTYFNESVQGLSNGSAVKYRGVPIGNVTDVSIRIADKLVRVDMSIHLDKFITTESGGNDDRDASFDQFMRKELSDGLRCRLEYAGITGMRYIGLDYIAPPGSPVPLPPTYMPVDVIFVPSAPSAFNDIIEALSTSLERISKIRFEDISDDLEHSLTQLSGLLSDPALKSMISHLNEASDSLENSTRNVAAVFSEKRLNELAASLEKNLSDLNRLTNQLADESRRARVADSATAFRDAAAAMVDGQENFANTLGKLNRALDAMKALTDYLSE
ncbi:MAG: MlaD family protein, partial [Victivallaceae bacterium]|nr:MlaD family protein [Victivallaceae bacterium]